MSCPSNSMKFPDTQLTFLRLQTVHVYLCADIIVFHSGQVLNYLASQIRKPSYRENIKEKISILRKKKKNSFIILQLRQCSSGTVVN